MKLSDVSERDLGVWVTGATVHTAVEQNLEIIKGAINTWGWTAYDMKTWKTWYDLHTMDVPREPTADDLEDLSWILDEAVEWLTSQLPAGFYFTFCDTDFILTHEDYEESQ